MGKPFRFLSYCMDFIYNTNDNSDIIPERVVVYHALFKISNLPSRYPFCDRGCQSPTY